MQVNLNTNKAVSSIKSFVQSHGGEAKHSEVLELLARICGFQNYRAMAAVTGESTRGAKATVASPENGQPIENVDNVVFRTTVEDWDKEERDNSPVYDFIVENNGENFRVLMKPQGTHLENFGGRAILDVNFEVNDGVPCAHMTNDSADVVAVSVYGTGGGLLVRPDDCQWMPADTSGVPSALGEVAQQACAAHEMHNAYAAVIDTQAKYSDEPYEVVTARENVIRKYVDLAVTAALDDAGLSRSNQTYRERMFASMERQLGKEGLSEANRRVLVILSNKTKTASGAEFSAEKKPELPCTRTEVAHPIRRKDIGSVIEVRLDDTIDVMHEYLWVVAEQRNRHGLVAEDSYQIMPTSYPIGTPPQVLRVVADNLAWLAAFYVSAGYALELDSILRQIAQSPAPHELSRACVDIAESAEDKHTAHQLVIEALKLTN